VSLDRSHTRMNFYGNVHVGVDITIEELRSMYDIVVLAYGCESDRKLGIPGEENLSGIFSAREFVAWYNGKAKKREKQCVCVGVCIGSTLLFYLYFLRPNPHFFFSIDLGHPDYQHIGPKIVKAFGSQHENNNNNNKTSQDDNPTDSTTTTLVQQDDADYHDIPVVVIGQGNVALDCARILSKGYHDLYETDIITEAIQILQKGVKNISVLGRRGHVQGAFTIKELRELTKLNDTQMWIQRNEMELGLTPSSQVELSEGPQSKAKKRIDELLRQVASQGTCCLLFFAPFATESTLITFLPWLHRTILSRIES
jgi:adrenodoxin-NADP+ reductase